MITVGEIAARAFDAVARATGGAVQDATLSDGTTNYSGRVVFGGETAPAGFPVAKPDSKARQAYLEGFSAIPDTGWTLEATKGTYYVLSRLDVAEAGGMTVASVIADSDLAWVSATIQSKTRTSNGAGGYTEAWSAITGGSDVQIGLWAISGQERWASERTEAVSQWRAVLPYLDGVTEACRVVVGDRVYNIRFADDAQRRGAWLVLELGLGVAV